MAWYKRYAIPFQSRLGTQYRLYILTQTDGSLVTLTGAADPFVTEEPDDPDIFLPMRGQTGTIRIIDDTGTLLSTLMPENNTQKLVRLYSGVWDSAYTTFTDGLLQWQGFLQADAFTQPWDGQKKVIELPVKSLVAALEDVSLSAADAGSLMTVSQLFVKAFTALGVTPSYVNLLSSLYGSYVSSIYHTGFFNLVLQSEVLYSREETNDEGQSTRSWVGSSYADAISAALRLFGLMMRDYRGEVTLAHYDVPSGSSIHWVRLSWTYITGTSLTSWTESWPSYTALLSALTFRGKDNTEGFSQGARSAVVTLPVTDYEAGVELPDTAEDSSTVYSPTISNPTVAVQAHAPRTGSTETFSFRKYTYNTQETDAGTSTYALCITNSVLVHTTTWKDDEYRVTGAFPCRWYHTTDGSAPELKNGLFLSQRYYYTSTQINKTCCYALESDLSFTLKDGYLRLRLKNYDFDQGSAYNGGGTPGTPHFGPWDSLSAQSDCRTRLYIIIRFGDMFWNKTSSAWETYSSSAVYSYIQLYNGEIDSNYESTMRLSETDGYFIPLSGEMSGKITIYISDFALNQKNDGTGSLNPRMVHGRILTDLAIDFLPVQSGTASSRSENCYRQTILQSGFSSEQAVTLTVGTMNNNRRSPSFIKSSSGTFIETVNFLDSSHAAVGKRPEKNLLSRIAAHYATVRRSYKVTVQSLSALTTTLYTYLSRHFFGVETRRDWRQDESEIKFIEVS